MFRSCFFNSQTYHKTLPSNCIYIYVSTTTVAYIDVETSFQAHDTLKMLVQRKKAQVSVSMYHWTKE